MDTRPHCALLLPLCHCPTAVHCAPANMLSKDTAFYQKSVRPKALPKFTWSRVVLGQHWEILLSCILGILVQCTALQCSALQCTALHCTALHCTALHLKAPLPDHRWLAGALTLARIRPVKRSSGERYNWNLISLLISRQNTCKLFLTKY